VTIPAVSSSDGADLGDDETRQMEVWRWLTRMPLDPVPVRRAGQLVLVLDGEIWSQRLSRTTVDGR